MSLSHYLMLSGIVFCIGLMGVLIHRKNLLIVLMSIELILLAANINFVAFSQYLGHLDGQIFVFFILTVAACEASIALAILVLLFRDKKTGINLEKIKSMQG
jgi:NADH-quinone oxidoreductase subunit K